MGSMVRAIFSLALAICAMGREVPVTNVDEVLEELTSVLGKDLEKLFSQAGLGGGLEEENDAPAADILFTFADGDALHVKQVVVNNGVTTMTLAPPQKEMKVTCTTKNQDGSPSAVYDVLVDFVDDQDITLQYDALACPPVWTGSDLLGNPYRGTNNIEAWKCTTKFQASNLWLDHLKLRLDWGASEAPGRYLFLALHQMHNLDVLFHQGYHVQLEFDRAALVLPAVEGTAHDRQLPDWPDLDTMLNNALLIGWPKHSDGTKQIITSGPTGGAIKIIGTLIGVLPLAYTDWGFVARVDPDEVVEEEVALSVENVDGEPHCHFGDMTYVHGEAWRPRNKIKTLFAAEGDALTMDPIGPSNREEMGPEEARGILGTAYNYTIGLGVSAVGSAASAVGSASAYSTEQLLICGQLGGLAALGELAGSPPEAGDSPTELDLPAFSYRRIAERRGFPVLSVAQLEVKPASGGGDRLEQLIPACSYHDRNIAVAASALNAGTYFSLDVKLPRPVDFDPQATGKSVITMDVTVEEDQAEGAVHGLQRFEMEVEEAAVVIKLAGVNNPVTSGFLLRSSVAAPLDVVIYSHKADEAHEIDGTYHLASDDFTPVLSYSYRGKASTVCARFPPKFEIDFDITDEAGLSAIRKIEGTHPTSPIQFIVNVDPDQPEFDYAQLNLVGMEVDVHTIGKAPTRVTVHEKGHKTHRVDIAEENRGWLITPNVPYVYRKTGVSGVFQRGEVTITEPTKACRKRAKHKAPFVQISGFVGTAKQIIFAFVNKSLGALVGASAGLPRRLWNMVTSTFSRSSEARAFCDILTLVMGASEAALGEEATSDTDE